MSIYTLDHAGDILTALRSTGTPLDVTLINRTALLAQQTAREAIDRADGINSSLRDVVSTVILSARQLSQRASDSLDASNSKLGMSCVVGVYCEMCPSQITLQPSLLLLRGWSS